MEGKKRRPIGYWMESRTEDGNSERNENSAADESQTNASEQAARDHVEDGDWQREAEETVNDRERMNDLGDKRDEFTQKKGLSRVRQQLVLLWDYLSV